MRNQDERIERLREKLEVSERVRDEQTQKIVFLEKQVEIRDAEIKRLGGLFKGG